MKHSLLTVCHDLTCRKDCAKCETYQCAGCNGVFIKGWTDEEAIAEMKVNGFDVLPADELVCVCDDCYKTLMGWVQQPRKEKGGK